VALVYDLEDTVGPELPVPLARAHWATGEITARRMGYFAHQLASKGIDVQFISYGDGLAGFVQTTSRDPMQAVRRSKSSKEKPDYRLRVNKNHDPNVPFATLAHELAHQ
jgi:hypothetical protein